MVTVTLPETTYAIHGFLSPAEMELLHRLASEVPDGGHIVEIGSFQGKSTVCLGLGAKQAGAQVWAVDPHEDCQINETTHYGPENYAALLKNLVDFDLGSTVRIITLYSHAVIVCWHHPINLLWIDGSHEYADVKQDFIDWSVAVVADGKIAMHDTSGHYPGVTQALNEILAGGKWQILEQIDATAVLERV